MEKLYIFHDGIINPKKNEIDFIITILEYLDTPQYLRKKIYSKMDSLKYVGKLHPIRSPHHKDKVSLENIKQGEIRVGILEKKGNKFYVDVGLDSLIEYRGKIKQYGKKLDVKLIKKNNLLIAIDVDNQEINEIYWGYKISYFNSIHEILKKYKKPEIILTSRYSDNFKIDSPFSINLKSNCGITNSILIVFGSPKFGLNDIFVKENLNTSNFFSFNFFPYQGTQTVRLEESIFGVLSIMNSFIYS